MPHSAEPIGDAGAAIGHSLLAGPRRSHLLSPCPILQNQAILRWPAPNCGCRNAKPDMGPSRAETLPSAATAPFDCQSGGDHTIGHLPAHFTAQKLFRGTRLPCRN